MFKKTSRSCIFFR